MYVIGPVRCFNPLARSTFNHSGMSLQMRNAILVSLTLCTLVIGSALVASAQVPSAGDMQQKLDQ